ncbi:hypothetical protein [uncultured Alsobacter sp.]|nr:hypothetical protein [uncultured Alsobacter sp.]
MFVTYSGTRDGRHWGRWLDDLWMASASHPVSSCCWMIPGTADPNED